MVTKTESSDPVITSNSVNSNPEPIHTVITVPDPQGPPHNVDARIGDTVTWKCSTPNYPEFELNFGRSNPFDNRKNASFRGTSGEPISLVVHNLGQFEYKITTIKADGSKTLIGPFAIGVNIGPRGGGCPPNCG